MRGGGVQHGRRQPEVGGCGEMQLVGQVVGAAHAQVRARGRRPAPPRSSSPARRTRAPSASGPAGSRGPRCWSSCRDARGPPRRAARRRRRRRPTPKDDRSRPRRSGRPTAPVSATARSGKSLNGSAPSRMSEVTAGPRPRAGWPTASPAMDARMAAVSSPAASGHGAPGRREPLPARLEADPARAGARAPAPCPARRRRCPGAAPGGRWPWAAPAPGPGRPRPPPRPTRRTTGGPSTMTTPSPSGRAARRPGAPRAARRRRPPSPPDAPRAPWRRRRRRTGRVPPAGASPGRTRQRGGGQRGQRGRGRGQLDQGRGTGHRLAQAEEQDGQLLAQVAGQGDEDGGGTRRRRWSARGRPSTRSAGRPSPSWASTESVPMMPLASLAQA